WGAKGGDAGKGASNRAGGQIADRPASLELDTIIGSPENRAAVGDSAPDPTQKNSSEFALNLALDGDVPCCADAAINCIRIGSRRIDVCPRSENDRVLGRIKEETRRLHGIDRGLRPRNVRPANAQRHDHRGDGKRDTGGAAEQTGAGTAMRGAPVAVIQHSAAENLALRSI